MKPQPFADADDIGLVSRWDALPQGSAEPGPTRLLHTFMVGRAAFAGALLLAVLSGAWLHKQWPLPALLTCVLYALWAIGGAVWTVRARPEEAEPLRGIHGGVWWSSMGVDLVAFTVLQPALSDSSVSVAALYVLPVLSAGVLSTRRLAVGTAAMATLCLLGGLLWADWSGRGSASSFMQAGLAGAGYFVVALLSSELAHRLAREQRSARGSLALARQQASLNQLVIDEMQEGVLVVDEQLWVRAANPAARSLLGDVQAAPMPPFHLQQQAAWSELVLCVEDVFRGRAPSAAATLGFAGAPPRHLRLRGRLSAPSEGGRSCVLLLEDQATLLARTRQERMAAMGRMSAGVAHEIRNPLAAISQANALLAEDLSDPGAQRLTGLVSANVARLKRIVDDVMVLAAAPDAAVPQLDIANHVAETAREWAQTHGVTLGIGLRLELPERALLARFDSDHWRRVLINLMDNAWRHAAEWPGVEAAGRWIGVRVEPPSPQGGGLVRVFNPGPTIKPEVERYLFEPFYSTRSRGSGLGLHICRELCLRYGAAIAYQATEWAGVSGNAFDVIFPIEKESP